MSVFSHEVTNLLVVIIVDQVLGFCIVAHEIPKVILTTDFKGVLCVFANG